MVYNRELLEAKEELMKIKVTANDLEEKLALCKNVLIETLSAKLRYEHIIAQALEEDDTGKTKQIICNTPMPLKKAKEAIEQLFQQSEEKLDTSLTNRQKLRAKITITLDLDVQPLPAPKKDPQQISPPVNKTKPRKTKKCSKGIAVNGKCAKKTSSTLTLPGKVPMPE